MGVVKGVQLFLPETWPACILFVFHAPLLFLVVNLSRLPLMESFFQVPEYNALVERYGQSATFLTIYIREAHAVDGEWPDDEELSIATHTSIKDRIEKGTQLKQKVKVKGEIVVDNMNNSAAIVWGATPESLAVIRPDGVIEYASAMGPWGYDLNKLDNVLSGLCKKN